MGVSRQSSWCWSNSRARILGPRSIVQWRQMNSTARLCHRDNARMRPVVTRRVSEMAFLRREGVVAVRW